ncbi:MAG TPA: sodium-independent anion transporter [Gaiellaceae bacterium]|nr:sodium-independent anion transporter [Gaiellaceae bacterium]
MIWSACFGCCSARFSALEARWLVLDAEAVSHVDATGIDALLDLVKVLRGDGVELVLAQLRTRMQDQLESAGAMETLGAGNVYPTVRAAVEAFQRAQSDA